jgi:uncharacterized protein YegP (UPF0339 family)
VARFQCFRTNQQQVRWRLLGGNNRVLGVSASTFPDHGTALNDIHRITTQIADLDFEIEHVHSGLWWWSLRSNGARVASSARGFARRVDAAVSYQRFRQRAPEAETDPTLVVFQPGRRGREAAPHETAPGRRTA